MIERHPLTPHLGTGADITAMVALLALDEGRFITGQTLSVDGGISPISPRRQIYTIISGDDGQRRLIASLN